MALIIERSSEIEVLSEPTSVSAVSCGAVPRPHKSQVGLTDNRPASIISRLVRGSALPTSHDASVEVRTPSR